MDLTWIDAENPDPRHVAGAVALLEAARTVDSPHLLSQTVPLFQGRLRHGWDGDRPAIALALDARGRAVGYLEVVLFNWDNRHAGYVDVSVDPLVRRQGIGRALYDAGADRIRADGRTLLLTSGWDQPAASGFAKAMGLDPAAETVYRRQDLRLADWSRLDAEYARAREHATAYEVVRMPGAVPESMLVDVATMTAAINDAPTEGLDIEDEVFSAERIRAFEASQEARNRRLYRLVARERATGTLAGQTLVGVMVDRPWYALQFDTSVVRAHRGHRLGLLLKIGMMRWLGEEEPQLQFIDTDNAASNSYMIDVNKILGYEITATMIEWQRRL